MKIINILIILLGCALLGSIAAATSPGVNWTEINSSAGFSPRSFQTATAFNNQIWLIGGVTNKGMHNETVLNDIWSSIDGNNWTQIIEPASFNPRYGHGMVALHGKLWIIGGRQNHTAMNDVWSSDDGLNWTLVTEHAGFSPRFFHGVTTFDDRLWVIGGSGNTNDVWSSADGANWTLEAEHAGFSPRYGMGIATYNNQIWIMGGKYSYIDSQGRMISGNSNEVWTSRDGVTWTEVNGNPLFEKLEFRPAAVYDSKLWLAGGGRDVAAYNPAKYPAPYAYNTVWSSSDGKNWTIESSNAGFSPRYGQSVTEFDNRLWVIGGYDPSNYQDENDVWSYQSKNQSLIHNNETTLPHTLITENETSNIINKSSIPTKAGVDPMTSIIFIFSIFGILGYRWGKN